MIDPKLSKWFGEDKVLHFMFGFFIFVFFGWIPLFVDAIGKEIYDEWSYGGADPKDFLVTIIGGIIPLFLT